MAAVGQVIMRDRKPKALTQFRLVYNMLQITLNAYMTVEALFILTRNVRQALIVGLAGCMA